MFQAIAIHHARAEHVDDFVAFMHRVIDKVGDAAGMLEFRAWRDGRTTRLIGHSRWQSEQAFRDALPLILSLGPERRPEWSERDDDVLMLSET